MNRISVTIRLIPAFLLCAVACAQTVTKEHVREIEAWRAEREQKLSAPDGYLAITGLFELKQGANTFGSDSGNNFVLSSADTNPLPPQLGAFHRTGGTVMFEASPGIVVADKDGKPLNGNVQMLYGSTTDENTLLRSGSLSWMVMRRGVEGTSLTPNQSKFLPDTMRSLLGSQLYVRVWDSKAPLLKDHGETKNFPMNSAWRFEAEFRTYEETRPLFQKNVLGLVEESPSSGVVVFKYNGKEYELEVSDEEDNLFIVFGDLTNGQETYGGGRFVDVQRPAEGSKAILDFNTSRNPWCLYSKFTTCAFPSAKNRLPFQIPAGEILPDKKFH